MKTATWNGKTIAKSDQTIRIEGNDYFPPESINNEFLKHSDTHTVCAWKGEASYYSLLVDGKENNDAAWYYPKTGESAKAIEGYIAFWKGVVIE